jgi:replication factor A1
VSFPEPNYRYILSATAVDHTGSEWISLFNDQAVTVLDGRLANDMAKIRDAGEAASAQWNSVFQAANFRQYMFRLKAKVQFGCCVCVADAVCEGVWLLCAVLQKETVNDQLRTKVSVLYLRPVEYGKECRALLDAIKAYDVKP